MNKIFKTIWNSTLRTFVAVGENGKAKTKGGRVSKLLKTSLVGGLLGLSSMASALVTYDINGWITGDEGVWLDNSFSASALINVGLLNLGEVNLEGGLVGENALYWDDSIESFAGTLTTNSLINYSVSDLEYADEPYFNDDYANFVNALIRLQSIDGATINLNGTINHQLATTDEGQTSFYSVFNSEVLNSTITSNATILSGVTSSFAEQTDADTASQSDRDFYAESEVFDLDTLNNSTFTSNGAVTSTMSTSIDVDVEQEVNDIATFDGDDGTVASFENGEFGTYNSGSDWINYDDYVNNDFNIDQRHIYLTVGSSSDDSVVDSTITNNSSIVMTSNAGLDVTLDLDNGSVALYDDSLGDVDAVQITDVDNNTFTVDSDTYAFEFQSLDGSDFFNNSVVSVADVVDFNVLINYGGVDDSSSPWASSVDYDTNTIDSFFSTFTSDSSATLSNNEFVAESKAAGLVMDNRDTNNSTYDALIENNSSMIISSTVNYNLGLEQREWNDITADVDIGNLLDARSAAVGIEVTFDNYSFQQTGTPTDFEITNNDIISATANTNFNLSGQDTTGDADLGDLINGVFAEANGIRLSNIPLGNEFGKSQNEYINDRAETVDNFENDLYNTLVTNSGTIIATANLSATMDGGVTYDQGLLAARAVGVDMRVDSNAWSLTDNLDDTTAVDTTTNVGLDNSGTILATATATDEGNAFAAGFMSGEEYYENNSDLYYFQNQLGGTITATAQANDGDAIAFGTWGFETDLQWLNAGSLNATAVSLDQDATAYGSYYDSDLFNVATNTGSMSVQAISGSSQTFANAYGFFFDDEIDGSGSVTGTVNNSGSIVVSAANDQGFGARARFIEQEEQEGNITNSGSVRVYAQGALNVNAVGIQNIELQTARDGDAPGNAGIITNSGLLATYAETSFTEANIGAGGDVFDLTSIGVHVDGAENDEDLGLYGILENTGGVILASSEYNHFDGAGTTKIAFDDTVNPGQFTAGVYTDYLTSNGIIRNNDADGLNAGTIRALATTDTTYDTGLGSFQMVNGIFVQYTEGYDDGVDSYVTHIDNEVGGYVGALLDGRNTSEYSDDGYLLGFESGLDTSNVAGIIIHQHRGILDNGENQAGGTREYYNATVEGYLNFNTTQLADNFEALEGGTINGYSFADLATLGLDSNDLVYNPESSYQMIAGSMTGRDNYAFIEPTLNGGTTSGLRYNLAYKNLLADNGLYGDGGYSLIIDPEENNMIAGTGVLTGEVNNYCYGVFEGQVYIAQEDLAFYNEGRINTRIDRSSIASSFENTDSGILQIAIEDTGFSEVSSGQFFFDGDVTFSDTTNIRVSVRDDNGGLSTAELDGTTIQNVLVDSAGTNEAEWLATNFQVQDNRLDINYNTEIDDADISSDDLATDIVGYDTGLTTLEAAAARPTKNLGWLLDDYNLLHDADYQTRELNAYLYALGSSDNRSEVNAQLHKALPLLAGGNTLSNMQLLNDTRNNIEDRLVSRLDQRVGDVYMGKKNAWFRAFGNDQSQSTRDSTAGYDSKALGGTFGIDNMVGDSLIGAAFTYARNDVDGSSHFNGQEGKTRTWDVALYGSTPVSADKLTYVNYQVGGGIMDTSTRRQFFDLNCCNEVVASGTYDTKFARASINLNHRVDLTKKTSFTPSVGLTYIYMDEDAYTEKGAGDLKLHVKSNQTDQALATIAGRFDFYPTEGVRLFASALAGYDMINEQVDLKANFVNLVDSAFTTKGIDQSAWMGNAKAGVSVNVGDVELNAGYGYTYRSDFDNHTASLRALYSF